MCVCGEREIEGVIKAYIILTSALFSTPPPFSIPAHIP